MPGSPNLFLKLRTENHSTRVQDNVGASLSPIATALNATPIMGAAPPPWIRPELATGWANTGAPFALAGYHRDALGYVHGKGVLFNASGGALPPGTPILTLAMGYRPAEVQRFSVPGAGVTAQELTITSAGVVSNNAAVANGAAIDLVFNFLAEQ